MLIQGVFSKVSLYGNPVQNNFHLKVSSNAILLQNVLGVYSKRRSYLSGSKLESIESIAKCVLIVYWSKTIAKSALVMCGSTMKSVMKWSQHQYNLFFKCSLHYGVLQGYTLKHKMSMELIVKLTGHYGMTHFDICLILYYRSTCSHFIVDCVLNHNIIEAHFFPGAVCSNWSL